MHATDAPIHVSAVPNQKPANPTEGFIKPSILPSDLYKKLQDHTLPEITLTHFKLDFVSGIVNPFQNFKPVQFYDFNDHATFRSWLNKLVLKNQIIKARPEELAIHTPHFIIKQANKDRVVGDFRFLNPLTIKLEYSGPNIQTIIHWAMSKKFKSKLDLRGGY